MADASPIEWTDATWNPLRGCTRVSPGCVNCYAEVLTARFSKRGMWGEGLAKWVRRPGGKHEARWTGKILLVEEALEHPLHWRRPRRVFVNSLSDLFHPDVPDAFISQVFYVMYRARQHTFQLLTKRPARMLEFLAGSSGHGLANADFFRNVWLGFSAEDQATWDERAGVLQELYHHGFNLWASCEPLLADITLGAHRVRWAVVGGESGRGARPTVIGQVRVLVQQFIEAEIPVFVKQLGARPVNREGVAHPLRHPKGGDMAEWPSDLQVRQYP